MYVIQKCIDLLDKNFASFYLLVYRNFWLSAIKGLP
jgi:hypothetical protein